MLKIYLKSFRGRSKMKIVKIALASPTQKIKMIFTNGCGLILNLTEEEINQIKTDLNSSKNRGKVRLPEPANHVYYWINNKKKPSGGGSGKVRSIEPPDIFGPEQLYWEYE
jgi:hypothetical protein